MIKSLNNSTFAALVISLFMFSACSTPGSSTNVQSMEDGSATTDPTANTAEVIPPSLEASELIQIAILLDTSNSMDGLIDQAKNQLWSIVNKVTSAKRPNGKEPNVRVALYQYGNDNLDMTENYIQKVTDFTGELDEVSKELFALMTNGGEEYCGAVVGHSIENLEWSSTKGALRMVFIAGNEAFSQGPISFRESCKNAKENGIIVNTIFCGNYNEGKESNWGEGAQLADGKFFNINSDAIAVHVDSPYDDRILELNGSFNDTYLYYGYMGESKKNLQLEQDEQAAGLGSANSCKRVISKNSNAYFNHQWDLVDACAADSNLVLTQLDGLPEDLKGKSEEELKAIVDEQKVKRDAIKAEIAELKIKRESFVAEAKAEMAGSDDQLEDVVLSAIEEQAKVAGFSFENQ